MKPFFRGPFFVSILVALVLPSGRSEAQYFGQNKVQYEDFDFKVLHTPHFEIYYYPEEERALQYAARMAERWYKRHSTVFRDSLRDVQPLILYSGFPHFEETNVVEGIGIGTGGVTEPALRRIVLPFAGPLNETDHVIGHELVHAFQFDITGRTARGGVPGAERLPLWFIEGMAEYFSLGPDDPNTTMWMRDAVRRKLPSVSDLAGSEYFPYRYGQSLLAYIGGRWGDGTIATLLRVAGRRGEINGSIDSVLGIKADSLSTLWHAALHAQYDTVVHRAAKRAEHTHPLIAGKRESGGLNISPVISPDGRSVMFYSTRSLFSIDLYLADAATGEVKHDVYKTALDSHLQNLEFINSAGSWDPASERFAFAAVREGRPLLVVIDVKSGNRVREIPFPQLAQIFDPAWSPDGGRIAFSAIAGGLSDLFVYDLSGDSLHQLTNDAYADLQPAWSPDGKQIAFATDRFTADLDNISTGTYRLAVLDVGSGRIGRLPCFEKGKSINPQWSPDGQSIYFVSDQGGISNVYRVAVSGHDTTQVTDVEAGVSGITGLSPAISVSQKSGRLVYSAYEDGSYSIYSVDSSAQLAGSQVQPAFPTDQASLPPERRSGNSLVGELNDSKTGLPPDGESFASTDYHTSFHLVGVAQPSAGLSTGPYGTLFGGGITLFWSDILGNANLATGFSLLSGNGSTDISALAGYSNSSHRLHWGAVADQVPLIYGGIVSGFETINGEPAYTEEQFLFRQTNRDAQGAISYPFSRTLRTDLSAGFENISFSTQVITTSVNVNTGAILRDDTQDIPAPPAINVGTASAALVYDNSVQGATSPILGARSRIEISPTFGSLTLVDLLADYRQYLMPARPFTIAARVLHYGQYGGSAEDQRLSPLYLGYPGLVRGYNNGVFSGNQYALTQTGTTVQYDPLYGSKILVGNLELRFPLFGLFGLGPGYYGALPVELATFFDSGIAWRSDDQAWFLGGSRRQVSSVGEAVRLNVFGFAVAEADYVHPLNDPGTGWIWEFNLIEGF